MCRSSYVCRFFLLIYSLLLSLLLSSLLFVLSISCHLFFVFQFLAYPFPDHLYFLSCILSFPIVLSSSLFSFSVILLICCSRAPLIFRNINPSCFLFSLYSLLNAFFSFPACSVIAVDVFFYALCRYLFLFLCYFVLFSYVAYFVISLLSFYFLSSCLHPSPSATTCSRAFSLVIFSFYLLFCLLLDHFYRLLPSFSFIFFCLFIVVLPPFSFYAYPLSPFS